MGNANIIMLLLLSVGFDDAENIAKFEFATIAYPVAIAYAEDTDANGAINTDPGSEAGSDDDPDEGSDADTEAVADTDAGSDVLGDADANDWQGLMQGAGWGQ